MPRNSGAILWISESVFLYAVSLDSKMAVLRNTRAKQRDGSNEKKMSEAPPLKGYVLLLCATPSNS